jgi:hypothetical protein
MQRRGISSRSLLFCGCKCGEPDGRVAFLLGAGRSCQDAPKSRVEAGDRYIGQRGPQHLLATPLVDAT